LAQHETTAYALKFNEEENELTFSIGCSNFRTNRAFIWTIEAARALAGNKPDPWPSLDVVEYSPTAGARMVVVFCLRGSYGPSL
jgi:hypothetical protein